MRRAGEFDLIAELRRRVGASADARHVIGIGDDAAVTVPGGATATSVDALVEGVHFNRDHATLRQIGSKALATALSDLAAMGAEPGEAYVAIAIPPDLDEDACLEAVDGMVELAGTTETALVGGDVTRGPVLAFAVTVVGHASAPERFVRRAGARPGDALVLTGELGGAAAGLLAAGAGLSGIPEETLAGLVRRQLEPTPRLAAGRALAAAGATAMIDVSDGLGADAGHLAAASGVGLLIDASALPVAEGVAEVAAALGRDPLQLAVSGGEDSELLAAVPPQADAAELGESAGTAVTTVGEVVAGHGVEIRLPGGRSLESGGFEHLG
jgi:thiamine-monophosphate kinase